MNYQDLWKFVIRNWLFVNRNRRINTMNENIPAISMQPIGVIHSSFTDKSQTPIQSSCSQARGVVEVYPEYAQRLQDLEGFPHIFLLCVFHQSSGYNLLTKPIFDDQ